MMPNLIIFLIFQRNFIYESEFVGDRGGEGEKCGGTIEPYGIVGCVEGYDVFGEFKDAGRVFFACHYGAEISHCWKLLVL